MPSASASDLDLAALAPAETAGIVAVRSGGRVEFTHPLFGSALTPRCQRLSVAACIVCWLTGPRVRRNAPGISPWQRAAQMRRQQRARPRGGGGERQGRGGRGGRLKELACQLTPMADRSARVRRSIELAERRYFAGDPAGARRELELALRTVPAGDDHARVLLELGSVQWVQGEADTGMAYMTQALAEAQTRELRARIHSRISAESTMPTSR